MKKLNYKLDIDNLPSMFTDTDKILHNIDIYWFVEFYLNSKTRRRVDRNDIDILDSVCANRINYISRLDTDIDIFNDYVQAKSEERSIKGFDTEELEWIGRMYIMILYTLKIYARGVHEVLPFADMCEYYKTTKDMTDEEAVTYILEQIKDRYVLI